MAKGKDKDEEEYEFVPPDFDEDAFIHKEMVSFRATLVIIAWAALVAVISWILFDQMGSTKSGWYAGLALAAVGGYALRVLLPKFKVETSEYGRKEWFGNGAMFFFSWIALFIFLVNPPVSDHAPPDVVVYASPALQQEGAPTTIHFFAFDNDDVQDTSFTLTQGGVPVVAQDEMEERGDHLVWTGTLDAGTYQYSATATDPAGHESEQNGTVRVSARALRIFIDDPMASPTDRVTVQVLQDDTIQLDLRTIYLESLRDGEPTGDKIHLQYDEDSESWTAVPNFAGWSEGNNTFRVVAEEQNRFEGQQRIDGGYIILEGPFSVDVQLEPGNKEVEVQPPILNPPPRRIPGLAIPMLVVGILAMALARRRAHKN